MDKDSSKEGKQQPGEFTQLFSAYLPNEPGASEPEACEPEASEPEACEAAGVPAEAAATYEAQRPAGAVRIPLVENPEDLGVFTRAFIALQDPAAAPATIKPVALDAAATRMFAAPVMEPVAPAVKPSPQRPVAQPSSSGLDQAGTFRAFPPAQVPSTASVEAPQASEAEFTRMFSSALPAAEGKVDWAAIESRPAPLPGPRAVGDFTQMFGRADMEVASQAEGAVSSQATKAEGAISSFTSVFSPAKMEVAEVKMEAPAAAAAVKAEAAEPKQGAAAPKSQGPPLVMLAFVLIGIVILAGAAVYFFVIRK